MTARPQNPRTWSETAMYALAALLDPQHERLVQRMWRSIERRFGVRSPYANPIVHVSLHVAQHLDIGPLHDRLVTWARSQSPITTRSAGLGLFPGHSPVLYIPLVRSGALTAMHLGLCQLAWPMTKEPSHHYVPEAWIPHITLLQLAQGAALMPEVLQYFWCQPLVWELQLTTLALISGTRHTPAVQFTIPLGG